MMTDELPDDPKLPLQDEGVEDEEGPYWTPRRIILVLIILITLIAFLAYVLWPTVSYAPLPPVPVNPFNVPMQPI